MKDPAQIADLRLLPDDLLSSGYELPNQDHHIEGEDVLGVTTGKLVLHLFLEEESVRGSYIFTTESQWYGAVYLNFITMSRGRSSFE
jgi:hypothetical protein